jgi:2-dehydro-3-deoxy-D-gluconate 5-dehydrogenase
VNPDNDREERRMILEAFRLTGKNALLTGSSRGFGAAIALAEASANVALHGSSSVPQARVNQVEAADARHVRLRADPRDTDTATELVEQTVAALGSIDILINNAGMIRRAPAVDFTAANSGRPLGRSARRGGRCCLSGNRWRLAWEIE